MSNGEDRLDRIEAAVEKLTEDISRMQQDQERDRKWEDRTWGLVKWVGGISAGLSVSAAIALVGIVIRLALTGQ